MPDDYRLRELRRELRKLLPHDKNDVDAVRRVVDVGYPTVEPILPDLLKWIREPEWPVCKPIAVFLVQIGEPLVPWLQRTLVRRDGRSLIEPLIREVLPHWPREYISPLTPFVDQQAIHGLYGSDLPALDLLVRKRLVSKDYAHELLASKRRLHQRCVSELDSLAALLSTDEAV
jgi:Domain of unknown function (DUF5071)